ncbi:protein of unknown function [Chitinophaga rupis]|uniref:DUF4302 domain-containing protein n=1 Tax=Chitinophaga rupis TaxID=573321 RepID=A0A1H7YIN6_9BACT|nr:DUF4302 domain-containing protein [Chitinophaga rupis]SEM45178.1 protein of unknown function [Chitinophaga rupis]
MKQYLLYLFLIIATFTACKKEDDPVFPKSPDERLNDTLNKYQQTLTGAPYGWKVLIYPAGIPHSVFSFYCRFNDSNRVAMFSDFDATSSITLKESSYRLKALQQPSLLFDTYSYIHVLSDPDGGVNGGAYGQGLGSDFEFALNGMSGDTVLLTGRFNKSKAYLIKATQQEQQDYYNLKRNRAFENITRFLTYFKRISVGSTQYEIKVNIYAHTITFTWKDANGVLQSVEVGFYYTATGIAFSPAFTDGVNTITGLENIVWNESTQTLKGTDFTIAGFAKPLVIDSTAARRWWQQGLDQEYWISPDGFHDNGVDDAYQITQLPDFYFMGYWPAFSGINGTPDFQGIVTLPPGATQSQLSYGLAFSKPAFAADGRVNFTFLDAYGNLPEDPTPLVSTLRKMTDAAGFYLVQTGPKAYDMVSAKDGKAWISWFR